MKTCHVTKQPTAASALLLTVLAFLGCSFFAACQPDPELKFEPVPADTYFPIRIGEATVHLQLALSPAEQQQGLMFRDALPEDHGMLFIFRKPQKQSFWMKNTRLPLDIGYVDAGGRLQEIHKLFPFDESPVASLSSKILIAVETNQGWFANRGIEPGAQLDLDALRSAIRKRGFSPEAYPLENQ